MPQSSSIVFTPVDDNAVVTYTAGAYGTTKATVTGQDNSDAINAYDQQCAAIGATAVLPPGNYLCRKQVVLTADWRFEGTLFFPNNNGGSLTNGTYPAPLRPAQKIWIGGADRSDIPLSEVKAWGSTSKGSGAITGMSPDRLGQYIVVDAREQSLIQRSTGRDPLHLTEGFIVTDAEGRISNPLYANWDNKSWTTATATAERLKPRQTIEGLRAVLFDDGGAEVTESFVYCNRSNVTFKDDSLVNLSGRMCAQMHNAARVCNIVYDGSYVNGAQGTSTSYGFNSGGACNLTLLNVTVLWSRRSVDAHKTKSLTILGGVFGDGIGGHWVYDLMVEGAAISAGHPTNAQAVQAAGGNAVLRGNTITLKAHSTFDEEISAFTVRGDGFEFDGFVVIENNNICWTGATKDYVLFRAQSADGTNDPGRRVTLPKQVVIRDNTLTVTDAAKGLYLTKWLGNYSNTSMPQTIETNTYFDIDNNTLNYVHPTSGAALSHYDANGNPKTQIFVNKPWNTVGSPYLRARRLPSVAITGLTGIYTKADGTTDTSAHGKAARWGFYLEDIAGKVNVTWTPGSIGEVMVQNGESLAVARHSQNAGLAELGDERFVRFGDPKRVPVFNDGNIAGFLMPGGNPFVVQNQAAVVNYLRVRGGAAGVSPVIHALGDNSHIDIEFVPKGNGSFKTGRTLVERLGIANVPNAASDSAAASAGVAVGGVYRNGNALQIRLA